MPYWTYIVTNKGNTVLYIGITNDIVRRLFQHRTGASERGFAWRYQCWKLVLLEEHGDPSTAIAREKQLKNWKRAWKNELIEASNPEWKDLSTDWDYTGWYDADDPPEGFFVQHLKESWGGPAQRPDPE